MDVSREGPPSGLVGMYRAALSVAGTLEVIAGPHPASPVGPAISWGPLVAWLQAGHTMGGFHFVDRAPLEPSRHHGRIDPKTPFAYWMAVQRLGVFVTTASAYYTGRGGAFSIRWNGRVVRADYVDVAPDLGLAFFTAQLDDGRSEPGAVSEDPSSIGPTTLEVKHDTLEHVVARLDPVTHPGWRGVVGTVARSTASALASEVAIGSPTGSGAAVVGQFDTGDLLIGQVTVASADPGWMTLIAANKITPYLQRIATLKEDLTPGVAMLGVGCHSAVDDTPNPTVSGCVVTTVATDSNAALSIRPGDVITAVDGLAVVTHLDLVSGIRSRAPGDTVAVTLWRDGRPNLVYARMGSAAQ